jgi:CubicO group peptidase (beta-lactamase class C family)
MNFPMDNQIITLLTDAVKREIFPGAVVGYIKQGKKKILPIGRFTYDDKSMQVTEDTIYDVASISKSIPTASLILQLIDSKHVSLDEKVVEFIPELTTSYRDRITIKHLLTYTLDFPFSLSSYKENTPDVILNKIYTSELRNPPGTTFSYINATAILLGLIVERVMGKRLDYAAQEAFFTPLGMKHTTFHAEEISKDKIAPTEFDSWRGRVIQGEIHDESAYALRPKFIAGSAGLFSTVPDLLIFLEMLLQNGYYCGRRYFSEDILSEMAKNQLTSMHEPAGLGWEVQQTHFMGQFAAQTTFGKTGFTGCSVLCDRKKEVALAILSNTTFPHRREKKMMNTFRQAVADVLLE